MKISKSLKIAAIACFTAVAAAISFVPVANTSATDICSQSGIPPEVAKANGCTGQGTQDTFVSTLGTILKAVIAVASIVAVVFIIIGGINYMTSGGDGGKVKKAKDTILYAVIGLVVCALAFIIVNWVIGTVLKQGTTTDPTQTPTPAATSYLK